MNCLRLTPLTTGNAFIDRQTNILVLYNNTLALCCYDIKPGTSTELQFEVKSGHSSCRVDYRERDTRGKRDT